MKKEQFYDLSFEQMEDGTIRMEQRDYVGEPVIIDAHPAQIIHIASLLAATCNEKVTATALQAALPFTREGATA